MAGELSQLLADLTEALGGETAKQKKAALGGFAERGRMFDRVIGDQ